MLTEARKAKVPMTSPRNFLFDVFNKTSLARKSHKPRRS
jgi:hypothetical protein